MMDNRLKLAPASPNASSSPNASLQRIVLTGFMGCGKTTIGTLLARRLGWDFCDLDHEIERAAGMSVPQIFNTAGEERFRALESEALVAVLQRRRMVLALGGGAVEAACNRDALGQMESAAVVYLTAPFDVLVRRCQKQKGGTRRPVLEKLEEARERFARRSEWYDEVATRTFETSALTTSQTAQQILDFVRLSV